MFNGVKGRPVDPVKRFVRWSKCVLRSKEPVRCQAYVRNGFLKKLYEDMPQENRAKYRGIYGSMCSVCMRSPIRDHVNGMDLKDLKGTIL